MPVEIVQHLDLEAWRDFVDRHPHSNVFHTPEMFGVFARAEKHRPTLWAAVDNSSRPLALLLPVQIRLMDGPLASLTTRAVVYGSVLHADGPDGRDALDKLHRAYIQKARSSALFTELRNLWDLGDVQAILRGCGFAYEEHMNFLIDLQQPEDVLWHKVGRSARQGIRTARNKGTVIEEVIERHQLTIAYELLRQVYARVQVPLADLSLFEAAFDILAPLRMFRAFLDQADGHYIGAILLLMHKERIIAWYYGSDRTFSSYSPTESLIWHTIQWGKQQGFRIFDLGGAGKPNENYGPREFKAKFGGELVEFGRNVYVHSKLRLQLSQIGYSLYRRLL